MMTEMLPLMLMLMVLMLNTHVQVHVLLLADAAVRAQPGGDRHWRCATTRRRLWPLVPFYHHNCYRHRPERGQGR